jgi:hypothetical protein
MAPADTARYLFPMAEFFKMMSGDGLQHELAVNLERVAFVSFETGGTRLHFSAQPGDFIDVIDYRDHVDGAIRDA